MEEGPLLTKRDGHSSSNEEHIVDMTDDEQSSDEDEQKVEWINYDVIWNVIQFSLPLVQIVAAILVLTLAKDEHPKVWIMIWIIGYTCGCIATLAFLCWRCISSPSNTRISDEDMKIFEKVPEYFFVGWFVFFVWYLANHLSSLANNGTQHFWLAMAFFAFSFIRYVIPNYKATALCVFILLNVILEVKLIGFLVDVFL